MVCPRTLYDRLLLCVACCMRLCVGILLTCITSWDPKCVVNVGSPAAPGVPWLLYGGHWGKLRDTSIDRDGPTGPIMKRSFARPPPMTSLNTIPKQANERLT